MSSKCGVQGWNGGRGATGVDAILGTDICRPRTAETRVPSTFKTWNAKSLLIQALMLVARAAGLLGVPMVKVAGTRTKLNDPALRLLPSASETLKSRRNAWPI